MHLHASGPVSLFCPNYSQHEPMMGAGLHLRIPYDVQCSHIKYAYRLPSRQPLRCVTHLTSVKRTPELTYRIFRVHTVGCS